MVHLTKPHPQRLLLTGRCRRPSADDRFTLKRAATRDPELFWMWQVRAALCRHDLVKMASLHAYPSKRGKFESVSDGGNGARTFGRERYEYGKDLG
jgi:hypothetical protein